MLLGPTVAAAGNLVPLDIEVLGTAQVNGTSTLAFPGAWGLQEGDLVLLAHADDTNPPDPAPTGWLDFPNNGQTSAYERLWYKVMTATPDTSVTHNGASDAGMCAIAFRNVDTNDLSNYVKNATLTAPSPPAITTTVDNAVLVAIGWEDDANLGGTVTAPTGYENVCSASGGNATSMMATRLISTAGAQAAGDPFGGAGSDSNAEAVLELKPAMVFVNVNLSIAAVITSTDSATITVPSNVTDGQIGVVMHSSISGNSQPNIQAPTGWTEIYELTGPYHAVSAHYKVLSTADQNDVLDINNTSSNNDETGATLYIFDTDVTSPTVSALDISSSVETSGGNPSAITIDASNSTNPCIVFGGVSSFNQNTPTFVSGTTTFDAETTNEHKTGYVIQNSNQSSHFIDMDALSSYENILTGFYLEVS